MEEDLFDYDTEKRAIFYEIIIEKTNSDRNFRVITRVVSFLANIWKRNKIWKVSILNFVCCIF